MNQQEKQSRRALILETARQSESYSEAAKKLGITRERVRQVASGLLKPPDGFVTLKEAGELMGYHPTVINIFALNEDFSTIKLGGRRYVKIDGFYLGACQICGNPLPKRRFRCCSDECYQKSAKISRHRAYQRRINKAKGLEIDKSIEPLGRQSLRVKCKWKG